MSAAIEQPQLKECISCHEHKPHTEEHFELRRYRDARGWMNQCWRGKCRKCRKLRLRKTDGTSSRKHPRMPDPGFGNKRDEPAYVPGPKPCRICCSLPWRITGLRCPECGLECAAEPRPEMRLRRFDRVG